MILQRISPRLWVGRQEIDGDRRIGVVMTCIGKDDWRLVVTVQKQGEQPSDAVIRKSRGTSSDIMHDAQTIIEDEAQIKVAIIKQEVPWETITAEQNASQAAD